MVAKGIPSIPDVPAQLTLVDIQRILDPLARVISIRQGRFDPLDRWVTQQDLVDAGLQTVEVVQSPILQPSPTVQYQFTLIGDVSGGPVDLGTGNPAIMTTVLNASILRIDASNNIIADNTVSSPTGDHNFAAGVNAGELLGTGADNILIGELAGADLTTQSGNVCIGHLTGQSLSITGAAIIGYQAGSDLTSAANTTIFGYQAGRAITTGDWCIAIGFEAMGDAAANININEAANIAIGYRAMNTSSGFNSFDNIALGREGLIGLTSGNNNIAIGTSATDTVSSGTNNVGIGSAGCAAITSGADNIGIGRSAVGSLAATSIGNRNIGIGQGTMSTSSLGTADDNIGIGTTACRAIINGDNNIGIGELAIQNVTNGLENIGIGFGPGDKIVAGSNNIMIGKDAGPTTNQSDQLFIDNVESDTPLIHGDFSTLEVTINGSLSAQITTLANSATPTVAGKTNVITGGTTTITDLTSGITGQMVNILSEHAITISDNGNFFLAGGDGAGAANFVMASSDSLSLIQKADGNWYEISRSVN